MQRRVAILYPVAVPWFARCVDGIRRYSQQHGKWHLFCSPPTLSGADERALTLRSMKGWTGDAIIIASSELRELSQARRLGIANITVAAGFDTVSISKIGENAGMPAFSAFGKLRYGVKGLPTLFDGLRLGAQRFHGGTNGGRSSAEPRFKTSGFLWMERSLVFRAAAEGVLRTRLQSGR